MPSNHSLRIADEALEDIHQILQYTLHAWGPAQLDDYATAIYTAIDDVVAFPEIGQTAAQIVPGLRQYRVRQHILYYIVEVDGTFLEVQIARVLHVRMNARRHLVP